MLLMRLRIMSRKNCRAVTTVQTLFLMLDRVPPMVEAVLSAPMLALRSVQMLVRNQRGKPTQV
jgi:hypothetical protein